MTTPAPPPPSHHAGWRELFSAGGGPRYTTALLIDAVGGGLLRPFVLLYGVSVLGLGVAAAGLALSLGLLAGLLALPLVGRWIDKGYRSAAVASTLFIRAVGVAVLLAGTGRAAFTIASVLLGLGGQCWPVAHAALVTTVTKGAIRDAALAAGRSVRNAGLGAGALIATLTVGGGGTALRTTMVATGAAMLVSTVLVLSLRIRTTAAAGSPSPAASTPAPISASTSTSTSATATTTFATATTTSATGTPSAAASASTATGAGAGASASGLRASPLSKLKAMTSRTRTARPMANRAADTQPLRNLNTILIANLPYAFYASVLEALLPAVAVTQLRVAPAWSSGMFVGNTVLVIAAQVPIVRWLARWPRQKAFAMSGVVLAASYLAFWGAAALGGIPGALAVSVVCIAYTFGEILYTGTGTALIVATTPPHLLGRALVRWQLSTGIGFAAAPAVLMALFAIGPEVVWPALAAAMLAGAAAVGMRTSCSNRTSPSNDDSALVQAPQLLPTAP